MALTSTVMIAVLVIVGALSPATSACSTVLEVLAAGNFSTFLELVEAADLDGLLDDPDTVVTVLAPTDAAIDSSSSATRLARTLLLASASQTIPPSASLSTSSRSSLSDDDYLERVVRTHILPDEAREDLHQFHGTLQTLQRGQDVRIGSFASGRAVFSLTRAGLLSTQGMRACEAVVYPIDALLLPSVHMSKVATVLAPARP